MKVLALSLLSLFMVSCGVQEALDATHAIPEKLDDTQDSIESTNGYIRRQKLLLALDDMFKERNINYITPPTGMLAGGKAFAEEATPEELISLTYLWMTEVKKGLPFNPLGQELSEEQVLSSIKDKQVKLLALQVIAALTPQEKVNALIVEQINQGGRYIDQVYEFLQARAMFLHGFMLWESLLSADQLLDTPGKLEASIERIEALESITELPFADQIGIHFNVSALDFEVDFSLEDLGDHHGLAMTKPMWERVWEGLQFELDPRFAEDPKVKALTGKLNPILKKWDIN